MMGAYADEKEVRERMYERVRRMGIPPERSRDLADKATGSAVDNKSRPLREKRPKE
jgi:hypothetical protein